MMTPYTGLLSSGFYKSPSGQPQFKHEGQNEWETARYAKDCPRSFASATCPILTAKMETSVESMSQPVLFAGLPRFLGRRHCTQLKNTCQTSLLACRSAAWDPALHVALKEVIQFLGASRCVALGRVCRSWEEELTNVNGEQEFKHKQGGESMHTTLLGQLGASEFDNKSCFEAEDEVFSLLKSMRSAERKMCLLEPCTHTGDPVAIQNMISKLESHSKVPDGTLQAVFRPCVEREKTLLLAPRAIHYAVITSSERLVRMLIGAASQERVLDEMMQITSRPGDIAAVTPLFLAVLLGHENIVDALRSTNDAPNRTDMTAAARLQQAGLWEAIQARMTSLGLGTFSERMSAGMQDMREKRLSLRKTVRAALRACNTAQPHV